MRYLETIMFDLVERGCDARCIDRCIGTHIYRLHGGAATSSNIQERRGPSVNIQDTYVFFR
jgi:hypothetical protein